MNQKEDKQCLNKLKHMIQKYLENIQKDGAKTWLKNKRIIISDCQQKCIQYILQTEHISQGSLQEIDFTRLIFSGKSFSTFNTGNYMFTQSLGTLEDLQGVPVVNYLSKLSGTAAATQMSRICVSVLPTTTEVKDTPTSKRVEKRCESNSCLPLLQLQCVCLLILVQEVQIAPSSFLTSSCLANMVQVNLTGKAYIKS